MLRQKKKNRVDGHGEVTSRCQFALEVSSQVIRQRKIIKKKEHARHTAAKREMGGSCGKEQKKFPSCLRLIK